MNKWYISIQNKARGPFTDLQMQKKIEDGEIIGGTLTYKEGDTDWLPLEKQEIWMSAKKKTENSASKPIGKQWILLVENSEQKGQFLQKGPFDEAEVRALIAKDEVQLKDYCWKPGMSDWKLLFETVELGLSRKPKIEFEKKTLDIAKTTEEEQQQQELELEPLPQLEMDLKSEELYRAEENDVASAIPEVELEMALPKGKFIDEAITTSQDLVVSSVIPERLSVEPTNIENQVPAEILNKKQNLFSSRVFWSFLVLAVFGGGVLQGYYKPAANLISPNLYSSSSLINTFSSIKKVFIKPNRPKASYVMIKQLYSNPKSILVRSDAKAGEKIKIRVLNAKKKPVMIKGDALKDSMYVETNTFGEAFVDVSRFDIAQDVKYVVSAEIGNLKADKTYIYGIEKAESIKEPVLEDKKTTRVLESKK